MHLLSLLIFHALSTPPSLTAAHKMLQRPCRNDLEIPLLHDKVYHQLVHGFKKPGNALPENKRLESAAVVGIHHIPQTLSIQGPRPLPKIHLKSERILHLC